MEENQNCESIREKWVHEDNLINHRLSWLFSTQAILFAAYGLAITGSTGSAYPKRLEVFVDYTPYVGIFFVLILFAGLVAAISAQSLLEREHKNCQVKVKSTFTWLGYFPPLVTPVIFIAFWIALQCAA